MNEFFWWENGALVPATSAEPDRPLLAADSHRVKSGQVVGLERHRQRFALSTLLMGHTAVAEFAPYYSAAAVLLSEGGEWFPRYELVSTPDGPRLGLWRRVAPARSAAVALVTNFSDPRRLPTIKGPDLRALARLNEATRPASTPPGAAHETVICTTHGDVVEGATTSIVWWRDGIVHRVSDHRPRVPSVTEALVRLAADSQGVPSRPAELPAQELGDIEVWAVNALHGIRPVVSVNGVAAHPADPARIAVFTQHLSLATQPLTNPFSAEHGEV